MLDGTNDGQLARRRAGLALTVDARVGLDLDDELAPTGHGRVGFDVAYLQGGSVDAPSGGVKRERKA